MIKMEPITLPQPPTKLEFLEYVKQYLKQYGNWPTLLADLSHLFEYGYGYGYGYEYGYTSYEYDYGYEYEDVTSFEYRYEPTLADFETSPHLLQLFEIFRSVVLQKSIFEDYFIGDWSSM